MPILRLRPIKKNSIHIMKGIFLLDDIIYSCIVELGYKFISKGVALTNRREFSLYI